MNGSSEQIIAQVVERFVRLRSSGRRISIDEALAELPDTSDRDDVRARALQSIRLASDARMRLSLSRGDGAPREMDDAAGPLPELDGYDVIDILGRGGMGAVYEAYQQSTGRRVAVKLLLNADTASTAARRRFEREVELIARLQHPNIVSIIDSGVHRGHYFYVMDYVDGRPLDVAISPAQRNVRAAIQTIIKVCEAVDYAHQRGVLHRDLKPSNIIIDDRGEPHVLDFGLGKAFDPSESAGGSSLSEPGQLLGTLGYMSPEQARGQSEQSSVRSDVYSLGAIAYESITGSLPCGVDGSLGEVLRRIESQDPKPPSALTSRRDADLDAILLKAMEKSPLRRYATAMEFAADLQRYLNHETITARRAGLVIRTTRWVRRNRRVAAVGATAALIVAVTLAVSFYQISAALDKARAEARRKTQTAELWKDTLRAIDLAKAQGPDVANRETYEQANARIESRYPDSPEDQARTHFDFGKIWIDSSMFDRAEKHLSRSLELFRGLHPEPSPDVAETLIQLGFTFKRQGEYTRAEQLYREAIGIRERCNDIKGKASDLTYLGKLLNDTWRYVDAQGCYDDALAMWGGMTSAPDYSAEVTNIRYNLGLLRLYTGHYDEAEAAFRALLPFYEQSKDSKRIAECKNSLACAICKRERFAEAERICREALETRLRLYPPQAYPEGHQELISSEMLLGEILIGLDRPGDAEDPLRRCLSRCERKFKNHEKTPVIRSLLGESIMAQGRFEEAQPYLRESYEFLRNQRTDDNIETKAALRRLNALYVKWGHPERLADLQGAASEHSPIAGQPQLHP